MTVKAFDTLKTQLQLMTFYGFSVLVKETVIRFHNGIQPRPDLSLESWIRNNNAVRPAVDG